MIINMCLLTLRADCWICGKPVPSENYMKDDFGFHVHEGTLLPEADRRTKVDSGPSSAPP